MSKFHLRQLQERERLANRMVERLNEALFQANEQVNELKEAMLSAEDPELMNMVSDELAKVLEQIKDLEVENQGYVNEILGWL